VKKRLDQAIADSVMPVAGAHIPDGRRTVASMMA
jgi:hypothetical protein